MEASNNILIGTLNVRTLKEEDRLTELCMALEEIQWDIFGISEVRREHEKLIELKNGCILYHTSSNKSIGGVGFLINKSMKKYINNYMSISDRVAALDLTIGTRKMRIIQVYAPTATNSSDEDIEKFYSQISEAYPDSQSQEVYIIGDFNSHIGKRQECENHIMGPYYYGQRNDRGERLVLFCQEFGLKITNSLFKARQGKMWTWLSPDGSQHQIDFILANNTRTLKNVKVLTKFKINSDHRPVIACLYTKQPRRVKSHPRRIMHFSPLEKHKEQIKSTMHGENNKSMQTMYDQLENLLQQLQEELKVEDKKPLNTIFTEETKKLIHERDKLKWKTNKNRLERTQFSKIQKEARCSIRKDLKTHSLKIIEEIMGTTGSVREIEKQRSIGKEMISTLTDTKGRVAKTRQDILRIATDFYRNLYASKEESIVEKIQSTEDQDELPYILKSEIRFAIENLKSKKATGKDSITNEILKCYADVLIDPIQNIFNSILKNNVLPKQWHTSIIKLLHKKGCQKDVNNYRPITLSCCLYKLFMTILKNRLYKTIDESQPVDQAGFRRGFSTTDHLHSLNMIIEKYTEYNKSLYICFIDFTKAFDSISQNFLMKALLKQGVSAKYVSILMEVYKRSTALIKLESEGPMFPIQRGVKQGDPFSPLLFGALLEEAFRSVDWGSKGISINGYKLTALRFADDIVFFSESASELQEIIADFQAAIETTGLQLNESKTKIMTNSTRQPIRVKGIELEYVNDYVYLGQMMSFIKRLDKEVERRVNIGWKKYWALKHIFKSDLHISIKRKVFNACILPAMTYGAQTWAPTERHKTKLSVNQRAMERSMLNVRKSDRLRNEEVRKRTRVTDVITTIRKLKWQWAGHIMRTNDNRWTRLTTEWTPRDGQRKVGRPLMRWTDELRKFNSLWWRLAPNRNLWNWMSKDFIAQN